MKIFTFFSLISLIFLASCGVHYASKDVQMMNRNALNTTKFTLPDELNEISGLELANEEFYGFNDSGGEAAIYKFNRKNPAEITQTIRLQNATNIDWEEIAQNDSLIFVGDFGNNAGNRKDLKIYYFNKNQISSNDREINVLVDTIQFFYPEQQDFSNQLRNHNFDTEAMFFYNGKIHLFTKEWKSQKTRHFTVDLIKGMQPAWLLEEFDTQFLVTGADVFQKENENILNLVGYTKKAKVYLLQSTFPKDSIKMFSYPKTVVKLGFGSKMAQVEGVVAQSADEICVSAELFDWTLFKEKQNVTCLSQK